MHEACRKFSAAFVSALITLSLPAQWKQTEFMLGAYWAPELQTTTYDPASINAADLANYKKLKACGLNLVLDGMQFLPKATTGKDFAVKDYYLALIKKARLKVLFTDVHISTFGALKSASFDEQKFVAHYNVKTAFKENVYGIYLGDEPKRDQLSQAKKWSAFFQEKQPAKPAFINLLPRYGFSSDSAYERYLNEAAADEHTSIVAFDHYPFRITKTGQPEFLTSYFYNLVQITSRFKSKSVWATVHTVNNDGNIPTATTAQLRFMAFCPLAYGMKGLAYWPYSVFKSVPKLDSAIAEDAGKYKVVKAINTYISKVLAPVIMNYKVTATFHKSNTSINAGFAFGKQELIESSTGILNDVNDTSVMVGVFKKNAVPAWQKHTVYLLVVNKNTEAAISNLIVSLNGDYRKKVMVSKSYTDSGGKSNVYRKPGKELWTRNNVTTVEIGRLPAGDCRLIKIFLLKG